MRFCLRLCPTANPTDINDVSWVSLALEATTQPHRILSSPSASVSTIRCVIFKQRLTQRCANMFAGCQLYPVLELSHLAVTTTHLPRDHDYRVPSVSPLNAHTISAVAKSFHCQSARQALNEGRVPGRHLLRLKSVPCHTQDTMICF